MVRATLASAIALIALLGAGSAFAGDWKRYPGSMCVRWTGSTPFLSASAIGNAHPYADSYVDCPVVRDSNAFPMGIASARVFIRDANRHEDVSCRLLQYFRLSDGRMIGSGPPTDTPDLTWSIGKQVLSFGTLYADPNSHYFFSCKIPQKDIDVSFIDSYEVGEFAGEYGQTISR